MAFLPYFQSQLPELNLLQTKWRSVLNPLFDVQILHGNLVKNVALITGVDNVVNTGLARMQLGWFLTDIDGPATIYRSKPFNTLTLNLQTSADCIVGIWMF